MGTIMRIGYAPLLEFLSANGQRDAVIVLSEPRVALEIVRWYQSLFTIKILEALRGLRPFSIGIGSWLHLGAVLKGTVKLQDKVCAMIWPAGLRGGVRGSLRFFVACRDTVWFERNFAREVLP